MLPTSRVVVAMLLVAPLPATLACSERHDPGVTAADDLHQRDAALAEREATTMQTVRLGVVEPGASTTFVVPPAALGFVLVATVAGPGRSVGIDRIVSPSREVVHDRYMPVGGSRPSALDSTTTGIATAAVPAGDTPTVEAGTWAVRIGGECVVDLEARIQVGSPGGFVGGRLDLDVWVPEGLAVDGDLVRPGDGDVALASRLDLFFRLLSQVFSLDRGYVRFRPAPASLGRIRSEPALLDAYQIAKGEPDGQVLDVVLTNEIWVQSLGLVALGISPTPAAATRRGTSKSALVLTVTSDVENDGRTLLHEAGHFMGLEHTTELSGELFDPLAETPRCETMKTIARLVDCPDNPNLMFPMLFGLRVEESQRRIVHGSPVYRAYAAPPRKR